jgi:hypothetical protein
MQRSTNMMDIETGLIIAEIISKKNIKIVHNVPDKIPEPEKKTPTYEPPRKVCSRCMNI